MTAPHDVAGLAEAASQEAAPAPPARWIDRLSGALLLGAAIVSAAAAGPAVLRASGLSTRDHASPLDQAAARPRADDDGLPLLPPEILADPRPMLEADHDLDGDEPPSPPAHLKLGLARRALLLRDGPSDASRAIGEIDAGALVVITREAGDWAEVRTGGPVGWVKKSGIAVR